MTSKREDREALIDQAGRAMYRLTNALSVSGARDLARAAFAVFEQAHTPTHAFPHGHPEIDSADDEREAVEAEAERLWPTGREYSPRQTAAAFSVKELDAYCASAFTRGARYALGLRRPVQGEPTEHFHIWSDLPCKAGECRMEPQGAPNDAQIEAALQEWWYGEHEDTWEAKMRAALRAAAAVQEGENRG